MAENAIRVMCPNLTCRRVLAVPVSARGQTVRCRGCSTNIRIPKKDAAPVASPQPDAKDPEGPNKAVA